MTRYAEQDTTDPAEPAVGAPLRCAVCLAAAVHDSRIGTASFEGSLAVTLSEGTALCLTHFAQRDLTPLQAAFDHGYRR